jgi:hypothetical protein
MSYIQVEPMGSHPGAPAPAADRSAAPRPGRPALVERGQDGRWPALVVVVVGLTTVVAAFALAVLHYAKSSDVSTALAPLTGVVGTIVGAYFGLQVGSQGTAASEARRAQADDQAKALAAVAPPEDALRILGTPSHSAPPR